MAKPPSFTLWCAGVIAVFHFILSVSGSALSSSADAPLKAALVTLVNENDLPATLFSMEEIEDKFNSRYLYDWVFFSVRDLGNEFKELTSNATNATCIYEVIPNENWSVPGWTDQSQFSTSQDTNLDYDSKTLRPVASLRQMNRWNSAPFAKERRLRAYEWFWRVEPGAQLTQEIPFDVFRFMRDNGIAYGFNRAILGHTDLHQLSPRIKSFVDKYPELLHEEADVSWLISNDTGVASQSNALDDGFEDLLDEGSDQLRSRDEVIHGAYAQDDDEGTSWLRECFASWLSEIYGNSLYPTFEIGSLAFFRSPHHLAFFNHLDNAGDFQYRRVDDVPVHSLSASMFLPPRSVWNFRTKEMQLRAQYGRGANRVESTPGTDTYMDNHDNSDSTGSVKWEGDVQEAKTALLANWDALAQDLNKQGKNPALISGNTFMASAKPWKRW
ncbi:hypothetical protein ACHAPJ_001498 [Fusarium lateritium]